MVYQKRGPLQDNTQAGRRERVLAVRARCLLSEVFPVPEVTTQHSLYDAVLFRAPGDPLPQGTPWWGVVVARVVTLIARAILVLAVAWGVAYTRR